MMSDGQIRCDDCGLPASVSLLGSRCEVCFDGTITPRPEDSDFDVRALEPPPRDDDANALRRARAGKILGGVGLCVLVLGGVLGWSAYDAHKETNEARARATNQHETRIKQDATPGAGRGRGRSRGRGTGGSSGEFCRAGVPTKFSYQLASFNEHKTPDFGHALSKLRGERALVGQAFAKRGIAEPVFLVHKPPWYVIMAGDFDTRAEAMIDFADAKDVLGQGGYVRRMADFCESVFPVDGVDYCYCVDE